MITHNFKDKNVVIHPWDFPEGDIKAWEQMRFDLQHGGEIMRFGASEISQVCGSNKYEGAFKLFQIKLGNIAPKKPNILMINGNETEPTLMKYAMSYDIEDTSEETTAENFLSKNYKRKISKADYFLSHPDYPAILVSLDGVLFKGEQEFDGNIAEYDIPVEFKNVTYSSFSGWGGEIPLWYYSQVQGQLAVTGAPHAWFICLVDNRMLWIRKVEADPEWMAYINDATIDLSLRISKAKIIKAQMDFESDSELRLQLQHQIYDLEPEVDALESTTDVLKELYGDKDEQEVLQGDENDLQLCSEYLEYNEQEKNYKSLKELTKNNLLNRLKTASKMEVHSEEGIYTVKSGYRFTCTFKKHKEKKG